MKLYRTGTGTLCSSSDTVARTNRLLKVDTTNPSELSSCLIHCNTFEYSAGVWTVWKLHFQYSATALYSGNTVIRPKSVVQGPRIHVLRTNGFTSKPLTVNCTIFSPVILYIDIKRAEKCVMFCYLSSIFNTCSLHFRYITVGIGIRRT